MPRREAGRWTTGARCSCTSGLTASRHGRALGFRDQIPPADADGGDLYGYAKSPVHGWCTYYWPLYNGLVPVDGVLRGFTSEMWASRPLRHRKPAPALLP